MFLKDKIDKKLEIVHEHFNFKDFIGLSALIFGLLLSNTSLRKTTAHAETTIAPAPIVEEQEKTAEQKAEKVEEAKAVVEKPAKKQKPKKMSKKTKKKKLRKKKRKSRKTAANN